MKEKFRNIFWFFGIFAIVVMLFTFDMDYQELLQNLRKAGEFHVVRRKGREAAEDACDEEEFDDRRQVAAFGEEDEEDADAEGTDDIGQDGAVWEEGAAVKVGQFRE